MTEDTTQSAECLSHLTAELGMVYKSVNTIVCDDKTIQENQYTPPTFEGLWFMKCDEVDGDGEWVNVRMIDGELWAVDCDIGSLPVAMYHNGLTNCQWRYA